MTTDAMSEGLVPQECTLPTVEQPLRLAEFDDLFAAALHAQQRPAPTLLRWTLDPGAEAEARDLAARESACCSFFRFTFTPADDRLQMDVEVPAAHAEVLDWLAARAATVTPAATP